MNATKNDEQKKKNSAKFFVSEKLSKHATKQKKEIHKCTYYVAYKTERERQTNKN